MSTLPKNGLFSESENLVLAKSSFTTLNVNFNMDVGFYLDLDLVAEWVKRKTSYMSFHKQG